MATVEELQKELADTKAKAEENVKALQKKLTEKDDGLKKAQSDIEELKKRGSGDSESEKKIEQLTVLIGEMKKEVGSMTAEKQKEALAKQYPDILPDLLVGRTPEEQEIIVKKQRDITLQNYDERPSAHAPVFKDRNEIDTEMERVKKDPKLSTDDKMAKIRELKLKKDEI